MINLIAGGGLVPGPLSVAASGFAGEWVQYKDTGTVIYCLVPTPGHHQSASHGHQSEHLNSFGGGWVRDKDTGTRYYFHVPTVKKVAQVRYF